MACTNACAIIADVGDLGRNSDGVFRAFRLGWLEIGGPLDTTTSTTVV